MLPIRFEDITAEDIHRLVELRTAERKTLEYKQKLVINTNEERAEFLADISSLANAAGGDILFGIADERDDAGQPTGIPESVRPLPIENAATECARMEQIASSGISPRIPLVEIKAVPMPEGGSVIIVRVHKSWISPHMVTFANRSRFYSRNSSTGKMQLDVQQIGAAFTLQRGLGERLRAWKTDRIAKALAEQGPVPLLGSKLLFHFVPASVLMLDEPVFPKKFDPQSWGVGANLMTFGADVQRYNADGFLLSSGRKGSTQSYLQVFREGMLEYGDSYTLDSYGDPQVPSRTLETKLVQTFRHAMCLLKCLETSEPVYVTLSLLGMKGRIMALPSTAWSYDNQGNSFDRDIIICPDVLIRNMDEKHSGVYTLLPLIDTIWQAAGRERTPYIDKHGAWTSAETG